MLLNLKEEEIEQIKGIACHCQKFRFLNAELTLYSDTAAVIDIFSAIYKNFIKPTHSENSILCYIIKGELGTKGPIALIENSAYQLFTGELFFSHAHMLVFQHIMDAIDDHLLIHAGVVARNGKGLIIAGPSGFGKTTLMLELVARGYKFYSDEFCAIRLSDFTISAFPRSLGIRKSSPFLSNIDESKCMLLKNIGRGEKYLVDCNEMYPDSIGVHCDARYFLVLRGDLNDVITTQKMIIDLALYKENKEIVESLCQNDGIVLEDTYLERNYSVFRFSIPMKAGLMDRFRSVCDQHRNEIFYQEQLATEDPDFTSSPSILALSKSKASLELLKNLRNRSSKSKLLKRFNGKNSQLLLTIGDFLKGIDCYEMKTGPLRKMAEMIDTL